MAFIEPMHRNKPNITYLLTIIITANTSDHTVPERVPKWNFKKAKWDIFQDQCIKEITPNLFHEADDKIMHYGCGELVCRQGELALVITPVCTSIHYPLLMWLYFYLCLKCYVQCFKCIARLYFSFCLFNIQPWFYPVVKYCFNAIYFTRFIFVNSVIVSSNFSCNDVSWDFIVIYVWYFVSWNSISV